MATTKLATAEDLWNLPDDGWRYELIDGVLVRMSPPGGEHGESLTEFARHLGNHVAASRLGKVFSGDTGFIIERDPDTVLGPDVAFVRADHLPPREQRRRYLPVVPDLVVEIVSPSDAPGQVAAKVQRYLAAGVALVWVSYPIERRVVAHAPGQAPREYRMGDVLDGGSVLPGFRLPIADLFPE